MYLVQLCIVGLTDIISIVRKIEHAFEYNNVV
jgi:hypothetical protein